MIIIHSFNTLYSNKRILFRKLKTGKFKIVVNPYELEDVKKPSVYIRPSEDDLVKVDKLARSITSDYRIEWLDKYTFQKMKRMKQRRHHSSAQLLLNIEMPTFDYPVMNLEANIEHNLYQHLPSNDGTENNNNNTNNRSEATDQHVNNFNIDSPSTDSTTPIDPNDIFEANLSGSVTTEKEIKASTSSNTKNREDQFRREFKMQEYEWIDDGEVKQDNLVEEKHLKLALGLSSGLIDKDLKPNTEEMRKIQRILDYPPLHEISMEDKSLLWQFRYYLKSNKRALIKFLKCVDWGYEQEKKEATRLIEEWAEISTVDALALLSRLFKNVDVVRDYAVTILRNADDDEILDVLLELVQALRYEMDIHIPSLPPTVNQTTNYSQRGVENSKLAMFLMERATKNFVIANNLNWYLSVESEDTKNGRPFEELYHKYRIHLKKYNPEFLEKLLRQHLLVDKLKELGKNLKAMKDNRPRKILAMKKILASRDGNWNWDKIFLENISQRFKPSPLTLPLSPTTLVTGIYEDKATMFKSAMSPMLLPFKEHNGETYPAIFKTGDDLRQDQLVIQLITLMDKLLKRNGLDLKLTPYPVLACGQSYGFVKCVTPNTAMSHVIAQGDIKSFLRKNNELDPEYEQACLNFIQSCAGYCVITYILGIGDRHLDNVLLTPKGHMFHIDFGFILGRDPKPFAPPMKLCKEMVEGMGGSASEGYLRFKELCCTAYNILRKNADLILNMFILMADASIPDIEHNSANNQGKGVLMDPLKNIMKLQEKLKLDLNDAQAVIFMQSVINESEKALFPQITETIHRWAQYWRS
jgi:phosphatidylinositol 3-kinase